jgi:cob(I)alamin adenosyltransferase
MKTRMKKGLVQVYTGDGKGKTTAAFGLALRAAGSGLRISIHQFMKDGASGEVAALKAIQNIVIKCAGGSLIKGKPTGRDKKLAEACLERAHKDICSGRFDLVILDEINVALKLGLVASGDVLEIIDGKPPHVEIVLTGRYCPQCIVKKADLVSEMREIRHPYRKGLLARKGIEY